MTWFTWLIFDTAVLNLFVMLLSLSINRRDGWYSKIIIHLGIVVDMVLILEGILLPFIHRV